LVKKGYRKKYAIFSTRFGPSTAASKWRDRTRLSTFPTGWPISWSTSSLKMNRGCDGAVCRPGRLSQRFYHFHPYHLPFLGHGKISPTAWSCCWTLFRSPTSPGRRCRRSRGSSGRRSACTRIILSGGSSSTCWRPCTPFTRSAKISPVPGKHRPDHPGTASMTATGPFTTQQHGSFCGGRRGPPPGGGAGSGQPGAAELPAPGGDTPLFTRKSPLLSTGPGSARKWWSRSPSCTWVSRMRRRQG